MNWQKVEEALTQAAAKQKSNSPEVLESDDYVFPGAELLVSQGGEILFHKAFGLRAIEPKPEPIGINTVFDTASLTKAVVTTTLAMIFVERGLLHLDWRASRVLQGFGTLGKERITIRQLLAHCSGFPAWRPFYKKIEHASKNERSGVMQSPGAKKMVFNELCASSLDHLPGKAALYSDLGFMLLGFILEEVSGGKALEQLTKKEIFSPLDLRSSGFIDLVKIKVHGLEPVKNVIAPTSNCSWRGRIICGEVNDENAWSMGGIAAHAGLFSTALDLHCFAREMINCYHGRGALLSKEVVQEFWTKDQSVLNSTWALGWDTPSKASSSSGSFFSEKAVGHLGFTGCSIWIDPERELEVILLSNRIHPSVQNEGIKKFRPLIHNLVMETLGFGS